MQGAWAESVFVLWDACRIQNSKGNIWRFQQDCVYKCRGAGQRAWVRKNVLSFHELRHASQYLEPERFNETINRSVQYIIMFDGTCYKLVENHYLKCKLEGSEGYFTSLYLGQPHEVDANTFAYEQTRKICGDSAGLKELFDFWMPRQAILNGTYDRIFSLIDEKTKGMTWFQGTKMPLSYQGKSGICYFLKSSKSSSKSV